MLTYVPKGSQTKWPIGVGPEGGRLLAREALVSGPSRAGGGQGRSSKAAGWALGYMPPPLCAAAVFIM